MPRNRMSRRAFLGGTAVTAGALWTPGLWNAARAGALNTTLALAINPTGTTLQETIVRASALGYSRLTTGPGWPLVVRNELGTASATAAVDRTPIASIVHLTDIHIVDAQSAGRVEFLDPFGEPYTSAFRPHETLTCHVQSSMVTRLNAIATGPVTGRAFDCAVSTGDNIDNMQWNEMTWFMGLLDGGPMAANSGAAGVYEGVQLNEWADERYWHPESGQTDVFKSAHGFPEIPGLLDAAVSPFVTPAIGCGWYATYGNHDGLIQGNLPTAQAIDDILTGNQKVTGTKPGQDTLGFIFAMIGNPIGVRDDINSGLYPNRSVTPDPARRTASNHEWVQAHLDSPAIPGPHGHGYTEDHLDRPALYYQFDIAPGVVGISLDTGGFSSGSIGQTQLEWVEAVLQSVHARYYDRAGTTVQTGRTDHLVVLFSHFNVRSMNGSITDPSNPDERRYLGAELLDVLHRYPNIVAWVNGHHHVNQIEPLPDPSGRTNGFWDINTCSHVDWPEMARIVELADNHDGTLSIFCTMVEHDAPATVPYDDFSLSGLASLSRELSANDPQSDLSARLGQAKDLNVELVLPAPFDLSDLSNTAPPAMIPVGLPTPVPTTTSTAPGSSAPVATPAFTG